MVRGAEGTAAAESDEQFAAAFGETVAMGEVAADHVGERLGGDAGVTGGPGIVWRELCLALAGGAAGAGAGAAGGCTGGKAIQEDRSGEEEDAAPTHAHARGWECWRTTVRRRRGATSRRSSRSGEAAAATAAMRMKWGCRRGGAQSDV
jgi:hypothetical protein